MKTDVGAVDLMNFDQASLYFDEPISVEVEVLITEAAHQYGVADGDARTEALLHKAYFLAPEALIVLVALYRFYFYQHRLEEALLVADRALALVGRRLGFPPEWQRLHLDFLGQAVLKSMGLLRFYLQVLKAAGYLNLRLGRREQGRALLGKLVDLDQHDRLGGKALLAVLDHAEAEAEAA